jgi:helix-turn-helix protein
VSFKTVETVLEHSKSRGSARMVLVVIAECANHEGSDAWPAVETIAHRAGISRASVYRQLKTLAELGELEVDSKGGKHGCNRYRVTLIGGAQDATVSDRDSLTGDTEPSHSGSKTVSPVRPEPSEPSEEPPSTPLSPLTSEIVAVLNPVAAAQGTKPPNPAALDRSIAEFPNRDHLAVARDLAYWVAHTSRGQRRQVKDVAATFRNFLKRAEPTLAPVGPSRRDWSAWVTENLPDLTGAAADFAATAAQLAHDSGQELTAENVRRRLERHLEAECRRRASAGRR